MAKICNSICKKICDVTVCKGEVLDLDTTFVSANAGDYTLKYKFLKSTIREIQSFGAGANLLFTDLKLNENHSYCATILDPNGEVVELVDGEETYNCVNFTTTHGGC